MKSRENVSPASDGKPLQSNAQNERINDPNEARAMAEAGDDLRSQVALERNIGLLEEEAHQRYSEIGFVEPEGDESPNAAARRKEEELFITMGKKYLEILKRYDFYDEWRSKKDEEVSEFQLYDWGRNLALSYHLDNGRGYPAYSSDKREEIERARREKIENLEGREGRFVNRREAVAQALYRHPEIKGKNGETLGVDEAISYLGKRYSAIWLKDTYEKSAGDVLSGASSFNARDHFVRNYRLDIHNFIDVVHDLEAAKDLIQKMDTLGIEGALQEFVDQYDQLVKEDQTTVGELRAFIAEVYKRFADLAQAKINEVETLLGPVIEEIDKAK